MATHIPDMPLELSAGELETRYVEYGEMAIRHARVPAGGDMTPLLQGLPHDRCPSPHWGIVLDGSITITHADDTQETVSAGDVYHWPASHTGITEQGVTFLEIGPVEPTREFANNAKKILRS